MLRGEAVELLPLKLGDLLPLGDRLRHRLAVQFGQLRLVVEGVEVRHAAGHVEPDDPFGSRFKMRRIENTVPMRHRRILRSMILSAPAVTSGPSNQD